MMKKDTIEKNDQLATLLYLLIAGTAIFWIIINVFNVYKYAITGAVYEILWLPALLATFLIPVVSFICWYKKGFKTNSRFLYIAIATAVLVIVLALQF